MLVNYAMPQLDGGNTCQVVKSQNRQCTGYWRTTDELSLLFTGEQLKRLIVSFVQQPS